MRGEISRNLQENFETKVKTQIANQSVSLPDIKGAAEHFLVMRGECADQFSDEVVALLRLEAEHQVGARPVIGDITLSCYAAPYK